MRLTLKIRIDDGDEAMHGVALYVVKTVAAGLAHMTGKVIKVWDGKEWIKFS